MEIIKGKKSHQMTRAELAAAVAPFKAVAIDVGTGDGRLVYRLAQEQPGWFCIGVDAERRGLETFSAKIYKKPSRGGLVHGNALFVIANALELPSELDGLGDHLAVHFPWGSLLAAVVRGDRALLDNLVRVASDGASLDVFVNYSIFTDPVPLEVQDLPDLTAAYVEQVLAPRYRQVGILLQAWRFVGKEDLKAIATKWSKRLAFGRDPRTLFLSFTVEKEAGGSGPRRASIYPALVAEGKRDEQPLPAAAAVRGRLTSFQCRGHANIRASHHKTIEFTREPDISPRGTCIIGVAAQFDVAEIQSLSGRVRITVEVDGLIDRFHATINPRFDHDEEVVFRKSAFRSPRTLGIGLDKGADGLRRDIVTRLRDPEAVVTVTIEEIAD